MHMYTKNSKKFQTKNKYLPLVYVLHMEMPLLWNKVILASSFNFVSKGIWPFLFPSSSLLRGSRRPSLTLLLHHLQAMPWHNKTCQSQSIATTCHARPQHCEGRNYPVCDSTLFPVLTTPIFTLPCAPLSFIIPPPHHHPLPCTTIFSPSTTCTLPRPVWN